MAALADAGALHDPVGVEAEALVQMVVGDDGVRDVAAGAEDAHPHQAATTRAGLTGAFTVHESLDRSRTNPAADRRDVPQKASRPVGYPGSGEIGSIAYGFTAGYSESSLVAAFTRMRVGLRTPHSCECGYSLAT